MTKVVHRALIAFLLALAIGGVPLLVDQCAAACELARAGLGAPAAPTCHHTSSQVTKIGHPPQRCGHDHDMASMTAADAAPAPRALVSGLATAPRSTIVDALPATAQIDARTDHVLLDLEVAPPTPLRI